MPEEQSVWPAMAWPIRMDAGILCDRAQQALRRLPTHSHQPFSRPASKTSNNTPIPSKRHHNPNKKGLLCPKSKASGPRWRGRSAWMRESFAIGHSRPCDGSRLTAISHFPDPPLRPQTTRPSHQSDITTPTRKACYARRAKRLARDGVADPHGCGNPLRSGIVGLSAAPDSQPSAPSHQP